MGSFNVKFRHQMYDHVFNNKLPIEYGSNFENMMSNDNFKKTIKIMYEIFWRNHSLQSSDVTMLGHCCGVLHIHNFIIR